MSAVRTITGRCSRGRWWAVRLAADGRQGSGAGASLSEAIAAACRDLDAGRSSC